MNKVKLNEIEKKVEEEKRKNEDRQSENRRKLEQLYSLLDESGEFDDLLKNQAEADKPATT